MPYETKSGDAIVIFEGCKVPFVVRLHNVTLPSTEASASIVALQIVGGAYVHGIMHGEIIQKLEDAGGIPWKDFTIV